MNERFYYCICDTEHGRLDNFKRNWSLEIADTKESSSYFLLHWTLVYERLDITAFLLENGANPNIRAQGYRNPPTPLDLSQYGDNDTVHRQHLLLLKYGANPFIGDGGYKCSMHYSVYLMVEVVCGEADNLPLDLWRVVKQFIYDG